MIDIERLGTLRGEFRIGTEEEAYASMRRRVEHFLSGDLHSQPSNLLTITDRNESVIMYTLDGDTFRVRRGVAQNLALKVMEDFGFDELETSSIKTTPIRNGIRELTVYPSSIHKNLEFRRFVESSFDRKHVSSVEWELTLPSTSPTQ